VPGHLAARFGRIAGAVAGQPVFRPVGSGGGQIVEGPHGCPAGRSSKPGLPVLA
jgi:hypothetical protein